MKVSSGPPFFYARGEMRQKKEILAISGSGKDELMDLVIDTLGKGKQALVFANSKRSAESDAEKISEELSEKNQKSQIKLNPALDELSEYLLHSLSHPTKQCERLARCAKYGVVFHHAGLTSEQKSRIEDEFRKGTIRIICCTPTLAVGMDLPAFRTIITSLKRFGQHGMSWISVLEYEQISGRAGRPNFDSYGESIVIAKSESDHKDISAIYINGDVESITSKLAVEPVLRTYLLSLIASGFVSDRKGIMDFFEHTFWAHQFKDMDKLGFIIDKMLELLKDYGFIEDAAKEDTQNSKDKHKSMFVSASSIDKGAIKTTALGKRVAELYIDPLTANYIIGCLNKAAETSSSDKSDITAGNLTSFSFCQMISHTIEIRPLLKVRKSEWDIVNEFLLEKSSSLLEQEPKMYDYEYDDFFDSIKTAMFFEDWIDEKEEEELLEKYNIRPGEIKVKLDLADWLLYCAFELAKLLNHSRIMNEIHKLRTRLKHGVKEELLPLIRLKGIGRVRARKLFMHRFKDLGDIRKADITSLKQIIGEKMALSIKEQLDQKEEPVKENKRKGQISITDFERMD